MNDRAKAHHEAAVKRAEAEKARKAISREFAQWCGTDVGKRCLGYLKAGTLDAAIVVPKGHPLRNPSGPDDDGHYAMWRSGQNDIILQIMDEIEKGLEGS